MVCYSLGLDWLHFLFCNCKSSAKIKTNTKCDPKKTKGLAKPNVHIVDRSSSGP